MNAHGLAAALRERVCREGGDRSGSAFRSPRHAYGALWGRSIQA